MQTDNILEIKNLCTSFVIDNNDYSFLDNVCFNVKKAEIVGIVGESGCGKTTLSKCLTRIEKPAKITSGTINYNKIDLVNSDEKILELIRGKHISIIPQNAMNCLDPLVKVGKQLIEAYMLHYDVSYTEAKKLSLTWLSRVKIDDAERIFNQYPHQLSGGLKQRVLIAMAMICNPEMVIADEPTTSLDVENEEEILQLFTNLRDEFGTSFIIISHNLKAIKKICDTIYVMYCGQIVESGETNDIVNKPIHPYTKALLKSYESLINKDNELYFVPGLVPNFKSISNKCRFFDRCEERCESCNSEESIVLQLCGLHYVRCRKYEDE